MRAIGYERSSSRPVYSPGVSEATVPSISARSTRSRPRVTAGASAATSSGRETSAVATASRAAPKNGYRACNGSIGSTVLVRPE